MTTLSGISHPSKAVHAYVLQVIVLTNHMNGKDTHIRGLRILGPEELVDTHFYLGCAHVSPQKRTRPRWYQRPFSMDNYTFQDVQTDSLGLISGTISNNTIFKEYIRYVLVEGSCSTKVDVRSLHVIRSTRRVRARTIRAHHGNILGLGLTGRFIQPGVVPSLIRGGSCEMNATCGI